MYGVVCIPILNVWQKSYVFYESVWFHIRGQGEHGALQGIEVQLEEGDAQRKPKVLQDLECIQVRKHANAARICAERVNASEGEEGRQANPIS